MSLMSHSYKALVKLGEGEGAKLGEGEGAKLGEGGRSIAPNLNEIK